MLAYTDSSHLSDTLAKRGGIYLKEGIHVVMALEDGREELCAGQDYYPGFIQGRYQVGRKLNAVLPDWFPGLKVDGRLRSKDKTCCLKSIGIAWMGQSIWRDDGTK